MQLPALCTERVRRCRSQRRRGRAGPCALQGHVHALCHLVLRQRTWWVNSVSRDFFAEKSTRFLRKVGSSACLSEGFLGPPPLPLHLRLTAPGSRQPQQQPQPRLFLPRGLAQGQGTVPPPLRPQISITPTRPSTLSARACSPRPTAPLSSSPICCPRCPRPRDRHSALRALLQPRTPALNPDRAGGACLSPPPAPPVPPAHVRPGRTLPPGSLVARPGWSRQQEHDSSCSDS